MTASTRVSLTLGSLVIVMALGVDGLVAQRGQGRDPRGGPTMAQMTGTYELESTRGNTGRYDPPSIIAIERDGRTFRISSSSGPRLAFDVDGRSAEFIDDRLVVRSRGGNRGADYIVTFELIGNGDRLRVTREIYNDRNGRPLTIRSDYRRIGREPRWDVYRPPPRDVRRRDYLVPEGTRLTAVLDTTIDSRSVRYGERFSMTVTRPMEFRDARIDGVVGRVTPYATGRNAELRLYFDTIRHRGRTADFEGILNSVRTPRGVIYRVDAARDPDIELDEKAVEQGAIGAALGAIIGAIAGGGKGAAIGAVIGGVGGVIWAQDQDPYLDLPPGTEVTIIATSGRGR